MKDISNKRLMCHWYCDEVLEECQGEEEPCHEFVLAREYKIMEKNLMSDDLISRKAVLDYLKEQNNNLLKEKQKNGFVVSTEACRGMESALIAFRSFILSQPTAFEKKKQMNQKAGRR